MKRRISSRGGATLGLAVAILVVSAGSASATLTLTPPSKDFGDLEVGFTPLVPAEFTLSVSCNIPHPQGGCVAGGDDVFTPSISVTGEFFLLGEGPSSDPPCQLTLSTEPQHTGPPSCSFLLSFRPLSTGPRSGILSTGPGGPTATLTGNGVLTRPKLRTEAKGKQKVKKLKIQLRPNKAAIVKVTGKAAVSTAGGGSAAAKRKTFKLKKTRVEIDDGKENVRLKFKNNKKTAMAITKLLKSGKKAKVIAKAKATNQAGSSATVKQKINLKP